MIDILMATFNGEKYIREQLDSILAQTCTDWRLIIRDDGSTDDTLRIVHEYEYFMKIWVVQDGLGNLGPSGNFNELMKYSFARYTAFSDHDDIWVRYKLEFSMREMSRLESRYPDKPLLVHTDLKLVDEWLNVLAESFWNRMDFNPRNSRKLNRMLVGNYCNGNTLLFNRRLREIACPFPPDIMMHDWWTALVCCAYGEIGYINYQSVLYRQHQENQVGASWGSGMDWLLSRIVAFRKYKEVTQQHLIRTEKQAEHLLSRSRTEMLFHYSRLSSYGFLRRKYLMIKYGFFGAGFLRGLIMFLIR